MLDEELYFYLCLTKHSKGSMLKVSKVIVESQEKILELKSEVKI